MGHLAVPERALLGHLAETRSFHNESTRTAPTKYTRSTSRARAQAAQL